MQSNLTRRNFLATTGAGLLASTALAKPAIAQTDATELVFQFGPDQTGAVQSLIDAFNSQHEGRIKITWREAPAQSGEFRKQLVDAFSNNAGSPDVFAGDVIWTTEFADKGWVANLSGRIHNQLDVGAYLPAAMNSVAYQNRLWGVPWFTDAGMLFYRRDLLFDAGFNGPPETWDDLAQMAQAVQDRAGTKHGFVFQGAAYEGGVTNALEFIWSAGGRAWVPNIQTAGSFGQSVTDQNVISLDSPATIRALERVRAFIDNGVAPQAVADFQERDGIEAFGAGDAVFMRNWPFAYGRLMSGEFGDLKPEQIGVAPIPTFEPNRPSFSCLGGWNLMINAKSGKHQAAWKFIKFAQRAEQQRQMARTGGFLPVKSALYAESDLRADVPILQRGQQAVQNARARPRSPFYSKLSPELAEMFHNVLTGSQVPAAAVAQTQQDLQQIVEANQR